MRTNCLIFSVFIVVTCGCGSPESKARTDRSGPTVYLWKPVNLKTDSEVKPVYIHSEMSRSQILARLGRPQAVSEVDDPILGQITLWEYANESASIGWNTDGLIVRIRTPEGTESTLRNPGRSASN